MMASMLAETEPDDADLATRARDGDRDAFALLVERHYEFIHRVAFRWCGRPADAEDIAQEVCMRLGRAIGSWRGQGAFTTWLYRLTLNAARDHGRTGRREAARLEAFATQALIGGEAAEEPDDAAERLWARVRDLPDRQREAILLVYGEGMTHAQASDVIGCSENTVSWHVHEARKRLKQMMLRAGED